jgi:hypothetical protein
MKNILKDSNIKYYPLENFNLSDNISDNLIDYLWNNLFFEIKLLLDIDLLNALLDNIDGDYDPTF